MNARTDLTRWLNEAIDLCPIVVRPEAEEYLRPLLKRCHSKTKARFWMWLRLQLARTEETAEYLTWMQESKCPLEVQSKSGFQYVVNGATALIQVGDADPAIWRVPATRLEWALSMFPVSLKQLPPLESPEAARLRRLKRQATEQRPFLTSSQRDALAREIHDLEAVVRRAYAPVPRFMLTRSIGGEETAVHRLFLDAEDCDQVTAVDGDFLNFTTARVRVTHEVVGTDGFCVRKGDRPLTSTEEAEVPNLRIVNSQRHQAEFEAAFLQAKQTRDGDPDTTLRIQPNGDLGTRSMCFGQIVDAGQYAPLSPDEWDLTERHFGYAELPPDPGPEPELGDPEPDVPELDSPDGDAPKK